ncbi:MAG: membrane protein insertion efficiency factor YidD [Nitrospinota bacterium]
MHATKVLLAAPVRLYRLLLSPVLPRSCRFHPSCSEYALQAIENYSAPKALLLIMRRLLRCHPFHPGGYDPLPHPDGRS